MFQLNWFLYPVIFIFVLMTTTSGFFRIELAVRKTALISMGPVVVPRLHHQLSSNRFSRFYASSSLHTVNKVYGNSDDDKPIPNFAQDEYFMKLAIRHAQAAYREKEVPIGAVLVDKNGTVIAACRNQVEAQQDATAHAEVDCLRKGAKLLETWRLIDCTLYTTLEPCPMCLSAIQHFRVKRLVYGAPDIRLGSCGSFISLTNHPFHKLEITGGILKEESSMLLRRFFQGLRKEKERYGSHDLGRGVTQQDFLVNIE